MAARRPASGTVIVLLIALILLGLGTLMVIATWDNRPVAISILAIMGIGTMAMINGARQASRYDREQGRR